eukprot:CAMPEP_0174255098 /NCGR_PEP_ID=MMETSP0439-20130205/4431_1 /TAXON_ID=0 /ORGANISM="Stereomyxa ramosa, Strain Chinc5" /LENGTH=296 /DNA_ID=CAMNT_0015337111 /DNA_START=21 /DNA_END=911 /DNA_ORIENTATION=-
MSLADSTDDLFSFLTEESLRGYDTHPLVQQEYTPTVCEENFTNGFLSLNDMPEENAPESFGPLFPLLDTSVVKTEKMDIAIPTSPAKTELPVQYLQIKTEPAKSLPAVTKPSLKRKRRNSPTPKRKLLDEPFIRSLKGLDSAQLTEYESKNILTEQQQIQLKSYIRVIKNRESAQLSRERRKQYHEELLVSFDEESNRNGILKENLTSLTAENKVLKEEFLKFQQLMQNSNMGQAFKTFQNNTALQDINNNAAMGDLQAKTAFATLLLLCTVGQKIPATLSQNLSMEVPSRVPALA